MKMLVEIGYVSVLDQRRIKHVNSSLINETLLLAYKNKTVHMLLD